MAAYRQTELKKSYFRAAPAQWEFRKTVTDRIRDLAKVDPQKLAFVFRQPGQPRATITRQELVDLGERLGRHFIKLGIKAGDRVATLIGTGINWVMVQFGLYMAGAIVINSPSFDTSEFVAIAKKIGCVATIMEKSATQGLGTAELRTREKELTLQRILASGENVEINLSELVKEIPPDNISLPKVDHDAETFAAFTSGSSGIPKLVVHTHTSLLMSSFSYAASVGIKDTDTIVLDRPMHWIGGYPLFFLGCGCTLVYVGFHVDAGEDDKFFVDAIRNENAKTALLMEYQVYRLLKHSELRSDLPILDRGITGGQRLSVKAAESILTLCNDAVVVYAATECVHLFSFFFQDISEIEEGIAGYATPGCEVKIAEDDGEVVDIEVEGEVCIRSPASAKGYIKFDGRQEAILDKEGWFHMGDIGLLRPDGLLVIKGRKTEMIKRANVKIFPAYIENKLRENLDIADVVVVGVPDEKVYQEVCACIIVKPEAPLTIEDIKQRANDIFKPSLAPDGLGYMPGHFLLIEEFPRTESGKSQRVELSKMAASLVNS